MGDTKSRCVIRGFPRNDAGKGLNTFRIENSFGPPVKGLTDPPIKFGMTRALKYAKSFLNLYINGTRFGLLFQGGCGCGKTKLLCAVGSELLSQGIERSIKYVTMADFIKIVSKNLQSQLERPNILMVDNFDLSVYAKWSPSILAVLSKRADNKKPTLIATRFSIAVMTSWAEGDFKSLMAGCSKMVTIDLPDFNMAVKQKEISEIFEKGCDGD